jgi:hypothetical protein
LQHKTRSASARASAQESGSLDTQGAAEKSQASAAAPSGGVEELPVKLLLEGGHRRHGDGVGGERRDRSNKENIGSAREEKLREVGKGTAHGGSSNSEANGSHVRTRVYRTSDFLEDSSDDGFIDVDSNVSRSQAQGRAKQQEPEPHARRAHENANSSASSDGGSQSLRNTGAARESAVGNTRMLPVRYAKSYAVSSSPSDTSSSEGSPRPRPTSRAVSHAVAPATSVASCSTDAARASKSASHLKQGKHVDASVQEESDVCAHDDERCTARQRQQDDTLDDEDDVMIAQLERLRDALKDDLTLRLLTQATAKVCGLLSTRHF